jgi:hypothetical protein
MSVVNCLILLYTVRPFMCGVVEGFYGRPWTLSQRKDLFEKMEVT